MRAPRLLVAAPLVLLLVLAAACGGGDDDDVSTGGSSSTTSSTVEETTTSTTEAPETTTTAPASAAGLVLEADGLGVVSLGQDVDSAIAAVEGALGPFDSDSGWVEAASSDYGFCPAGQVRGVAWDDLTLLFSDGDTAYGTAGEQQHLFDYRLAGGTPEATSAAGIGFGSSSAEIREAYGSAATQVSGDELVAPRFDVDLGGTEPLRFTLDDSGTVVAVEGGAPCGE